MGEGLEALGNQMGIRGQLEGWRQGTEEGQFARGWDWTGWQDWGGVEARESVTAQEASLQGWEVERVSGAAAAGLKSTQALHWGSVRRGPMVRS